MAKVSLRVYNHEIEGLVEGGQLNESIAHCQHILKTYSMYVDTYRLLGKAFLESRRYSDAADIFGRTLMAVPDDFVSHVGMSIIRDDENKLDEAIWHMERAFEVQPSNPAIQGELRRLYGRRDGVEPPKIRLSRDALANMYSQGELFTQAIAEIRDEMAEDPNRPDLQVMLARAYYRAGKKVEAAEMAATLLKKYPYCLDAVRILVDVLPDTTKGENILAYRQRLALLDPYSSFAKGSMFNSNQVPDTAVEMDRLEYRTESAGAPVQANWASSLGIKLETDGAVEAKPGWMNPEESQAAAPEPASPLPPVNEPPAFVPPLVDQVPLEAAAAPAAPAAAEGDGSIPEWMRSAGWQESNGAVQEGSLESSDLAPAEPTDASEMPDWLKSLAPAGVTAPPAPESEQVPTFPMNPEIAPAEGLPDWLKADAPAETGAAGTPTEAVDFLGGKEAEPGTGAGASPFVQEAETPGTAAAPAPEAEGDLSWLQSLAPKNEGQGAAPEAPAAEPASETPDWLNELAGSPPQPAEEEPPHISNIIQDIEPPIPNNAPAAPMAEESPFALPEEPAFTPPAEGTSKPLGIEDDTMAWLESLAAKQGAKPEELLTKPEDRSETPPDWIQKASEEKAPEPPKTEPMREYPPAAEIEKPAPPAVKEELPPEFASPAPSEPSPPPPASSERPRPGQPPLSGTGDLTITSWLNKLDVDEAVNQAKGGASQPVPSAEDLPDWLKGLEKPAAPAAPVNPPEDTPAWLRGAASGGETQKAPESGKAEWMDENALIGEKPSPTSPEEWLPAEKVDGPSRPPSPAPPAVQEKAPAAPAAPAVPPASPARPTGSLGKGQAQEKDMEMLHAAQAALNGSQLNEAMQEYGKLIKKGRLLDEIIHDLREAIYRFPVDIVVWQTLGDAYMRANHLQEALDAYNKAEELLR